MSKRVCVIVITFNGREHLARLFPHLHGLDPESDQVVLVDNASSDGAGDYVATNFPNVKIFRNEQNLGFARGNNLAMQWALSEEFEYVLLLNDDTEIVDQGWLQDGLLAAADPEVGVVGFRLARTPEPVAPGAFLVRSIPRVEGWCMLLKSRVLRDVGLFDETYFAYSEESDLQARAEMAGYRIVEVDTPVFHLGGGSFGANPANRVYLRARNWVRYVLKVEAPSKIPLRLLQIFYIHAVPIPWAPISLKPAVLKHDAGSRWLTIWLFSKALFWNLQNLPQTLRSRREDLSRARRANLRLATP